jgi:hypothetical protein
MDSKSLKIDEMKSRLKLETKFNQTNVKDKRFIRTKVK